MARRPAVEAAQIVRPPLTANDAARVAGTYVPPVRSDFLCQVVDVIDRAELDGQEAVDRLQRFVTDWQHHAQAKMLVEIGEVLGFLTADLPGSDALDDLICDAHAAGSTVDDATDVLTALKERNDWEPAADFVEDLRRHHDIPRVDTIELLRAKLIDEAPSADEASAEKAHAADLQKALDACEDEKRKIETDRDALMEELESLKATNTALRERMGRIFDLSKGGSGA